MWEDANTGMAAFHTKMLQAHLTSILSNGPFETLYSDQAVLIISGSKTKATGILCSHPPKDKNGLTPSQTLPSTQVKK